MLKKYLKKLCTKDCVPFSITIILSVTCSLDSDNILHLLINLICRPPNTVSKIE